ncbi:MAG: TonB-dependent receptor [Desulfobacteraceae bacterium]|nr:TonB-dependent receptor [Desulfobacteraceae bacterium]
MKKIFYLMMIPFYLLPVSFPWFHEVLFANEAKVNLPGDEPLPPEKDPFRELLNIIEDEYMEASESKTIADFVPGIITVLRGDDLENRGIRTVYEALALVPGLDMSMYPFLVKRIVVRGLTSSYALNSLKLLLNDVPVNSNMTGVTTEFFDIPVSLVERVDIIRGSGAVIYGENASSGVINVITRKKGNKIFGRYGRFDTFEGGGIFSHAVPDKGYRLSLALSGWDTDGADVTSGPTFYTPSGGPSNEAHQHGTAIMKMDFGNSSLLTQYLSSRSGGYFGFFPSLSGMDHDGKTQSADSIFLEARHELNIGEDSKVKAKFGFSRVEQELLGEKYVEENSVISRTMLFELFYDEERLYGNLDYLWKGWENHRLTLGASLSRVLKNDYVSSLEVYEPSRYTIPYEDFLADKNRTIGSIFVQDEFALTDSFNITMGLRYDNYNDLDNMLTPRLALIYRFKDHHIFKAQYAEGFKSSTYVKDIYETMFPILKYEDHEKITTGELGYIFKGIDTDARITLFYSRIHDLVSNVNSNTFKDPIAQRSAGESTPYLQTTITDAETWGMELELEQWLTSSVRISTNLSYVNTKYLGEDINKSKYRAPYDSDEYSPAGREIVYSANWLGNFDIIYRPVDDVALAMHYRYVGARHRWYMDWRDELDPYHTVDLTVNLFKLFHDGLTLRAGLKNIFDESVLYPSPHGDYYREDFLRAGRQWWLQLSYTF